MQTVALMKNGHCTIQSGLNFERKASDETMSTIFSLSLSLLLVFPGLLFAESLTLTTYYPSPAGDYLDMRVSRKLTVGSTAFTCDASSVGALWYDNSITNGTKACVKTALSPTTYGWVSVGGSSTNPCAGKTAGQACDGTTAVYVGYPGWMTTPSDAQDEDWSTAVFYCNNLDYGGYTDWVLPGKSILSFLFDNDTALGCRLSAYWSSSWSASESYPNHAWAVDFSSDNSCFTRDKSSVFSVRCVRSY